MLVGLTPTEDETYRRASRLCGEAEPHNADDVPCVYHWAEARRQMEQVAR